MYVLLNKMCVLLKNGLKMASIVNIVKSVARHGFSVLGATVVIINLGTAMWPIFVAAVVKIAVPVPGVTRVCNIILEAFYRLAVKINSLWMVHIVGIDVEIIGEIPDHIAPIVVSNHQSWMDIPVLHHVVTGKGGPILKFLMKRELVWVPIVGWICYALGFPRLRRGKGDDARDKDYQAISAASDGLTKERGALLIFAEGTRFNEVKRLDQNSRYKNLLNPRPGGLKIALAAAPVGTPVVDITIFYHGGDNNFWRCLYGKTRHITVNIDTYLSQEIDNPANWLRQRWGEKDALLAQRQL